MKKLFLKDLFSYWLVVHKKASAVALPVFCALLYPVSLVYFRVWGAKYAPGVLSCALCFFIVLIAVQLVCAVFFISRGFSDELSDFDKELISGKFPGITERTLVVHGVLALTADQDYQTALNDFKALEDMDLSEREKGVVGFYSAVCYTGLGFAVHAANSAVKAVKAGVAEPESLLLAARGYANAGNYDQSRECYDVLCDIAAESFSFPTAFCEAGDVCIKSGRGEDAYRYFHRSLEYGLSVAASQGGLALACLMKGNIDEAVGWYRLALLSRMPDPDNYRIVCEQVCRASGLDPDTLDNALKKA